MIEALEQLDNIKLDFTPGGLLVLNFTLAFIMFGVALSIKVEDFKKIIGNPKPIIVGFSSQFFILPLLTFILVWTMQLTPSVSLGMILVSACPGGNISNFLSSYAKGNAALSVTLTAIATTMAVIFTPFNFAFYGGLFVESFNSHGSQLLQPLVIDVWEMFTTVFILLGLPVVAGVFFAMYLPKVTAKIIQPIRRFSILVFIVMVGIILKNNFQQFKDCIYVIFVIVLIHNVLALFSGYGVSSLFRLNDRDRRTITIETGIQNSGLALTLMFNPKIFPPEVELGGMAIIAAWWGVWHIISGLGISTFWRRREIAETS